MHMKKGRSKMLRLSAFSAAIMLCAANLTGCGIMMPESARKDVIGAKIVVIGQAKDIQFWDYVEQGANDAGKELKYEVEYVSGANTNDIDGQIQLIQNAVNNNARAIVIAPNSASALNNALRDAKEKGVTILTIDADINNSELRTAYIGSINASAAAIAARKVAAYLTDKEHLVNGRPGKVGIISHSETSSAAQQRVGPFQGALMTALGYGSSEDDASSGQQGGAPADAQQGGAPADAQQGGAPTDEQQGGAPADTQQGGAQGGSQGGNPVIAGVQFCAGDADKAKTMATDMINNIPDLKVLYATNERSTIGVCEAVKAAREEGKAQDLMVVGYNANTAELEYIRNDILTGTMLQNPYNMGYLGVLYAGSAMSASGSVPGTVDTGVVYVYKKNLNDDDIKLLLDPKSVLSASSK